MSETFAERLKRLRQAQALSIEETAHRIGVTHSVIRRAEAGDHMVRAHRLAGLARILHCTVDYLLTGHETPKLVALHRAIQIGSSREQLLAMVLRDA